MHIHFVSSGVVRDTAKMLFKGTFYCNAEPYLIETWKRHILKYLSGLFWSSGIVYTCGGNKKIIFKH